MSTVEDDGVVESDTGRELLVPEYDLNKVIDSMAIMAWSSFPDGRCDYMNQRWLNYAGVSLEQVQGWGWTALLHPDDVESLLSVWKAALAAGQTVGREARMLRHDGAYCWFLFLGNPLRDAEGKIVRWFGVNVDVEDRVRAQEALRASERRLSEAINTIPATVWATLPDGYCDFLSDRWLDYAGISAEEARGWKWASVIHPDDRQAVYDNWQMCLSTGIPSNVEARMRRYDGVYRWFLFRGNPLRDEAGDIVRWYCTNVDIEDRKRADEALRVSEDETLAKVRAELTYMTRVASMGALTASIAHEVNQPLAGIVTNANTCVRMLAADPPNIEGATKTSERIIRDSHRAADIIARLRALFTRKQAATEPVDLNEATREVIALHTNELRRHRVTLRSEFAPDLPSIMGDRIQLQQVILNLLLNASTAMSTVEGRPRELVIETGRVRDGVRLSVQDSGIGVASEEAAERLFEPFYTTKTDGMGIGLAVSRTIVESHGGRLWAKPNDGPGATFTFSIPPLSERQVLHPPETQAGDADGPPRAAAPRATTTSMAHDPRMSAVAWVYGDQFGFSKAPSITEPEVTRNMARSLLAAAAGDGTVSEAEREWIAGYCAAKGYAREVVAEIETAAPPTPSEVKELMQLGVLKASGRILVYDAIRAASVDGYRAGEAAAVRRIAQALGIEVSVVEDIERLVNVERDLKQKRIHLLMPQGHPNLQK